MDTPEMLTHDEVVTHFRRNGAPEIKRTVVLVMIGGRIYRREGDEWRRLDNKPPTRT